MPVLFFLLSAAASAEVPAADVEPREVVEFVVQDGRGKELARWVDGSPCAGGVGSQGAVMALSHRDVPVTVQASCSENEVLELRVQRFEWELMDLGPVVEVRSMSAAAPVLELSGDKARDRLVVSLAAVP